MSGISAHGGAARDERVVGSASSTGGAGATEVRDGCRFRKLGMYAWRAPTGCACSLSQQDFLCAVECVVESEPEVQRYTCCFYPTLPGHRGFSSEVLGTSKAWSGSYSLSAASNSLRQASFLLLTLQHVFIKILQQGGRSEVERYS